MVFASFWTNPSYPSSFFARVLCPASSNARVCCTTGVSVRDGRGSAATATAGSRAGGRDRHTGRFAYRRAVRRSSAKPHACCRAALTPPSAALPPSRPPPSRRRRRAGAAPPSPHTHSATPATPAPPTECAARAGGRCGRADSHGGAGRAGLTPSGPRVPVLTRACGQTSRAYACGRAGVQRGGGRGSVTSVGPATAGSRGGGGDRLADPCGPARGVRTRACDAQACGQTPRFRACGTECAAATAAAAAASAAEEEGGWGFGRARDGGRDRRTGRLAYRRAVRRSSAKPHACCRAALTPPSAALAALRTRAGARIGKMPSIGKMPASTWKDAK